MPVASSDRARPRRRATGTSCAQSVDRGVPTSHPSHGLPNTGVKLRSTRNTRLRQLQLLVGRRRDPLRILCDCALCASLIELPAVLHALKEVRTPRKDWAVATAHLAIHLGRTG